MAGPSGVVASLRINLGMDPSGVTRGARQAEGTLGKFQKFANSTLGAGLLGGVGMGAGFGGVMAISMGVSKAVDVMGDAITMGSDLAETQTKLDAVFKGSADTVREWAETTDAAIITTKNELLAGAATFGNFLMAMGVADQEALKYSTTLTTLAADLASFNNLQGGAAEATAALVSGMSGETEAARRLGIDLRVSRLETDLLAAGQEKVNGAWTSGQLAAARYNAIMKDTATAQGDVARTAGGFANKARALEKQLAELQTGLGEFLLPTATNVVTVLSGMADVVGDLADAFPAMSDGVSVLVGSLAALVALKFGARLLRAMIPGGDAFAAGLSKSIGPPMQGAAKALGLTFGTTFALAAAGSILVVLIPMVMEMFGKIGELAAKQSGLAAAIEAGAFAESELNAELAETEKRIADLRRTHVLFADSFFGSGFAVLPEITGLKELEEHRAALKARLTLIKNDVVSAAADPTMRRAWEVALNGIGDLTPPTPPDIAGPFAEEFDKAAATIREGFGNVKAELANPPQLISRADRLENLEARARKVTRNLHRAIEADDPWNVSHWTAARARIDRTIAGLSTAAKPSMREVRRTLRAEADTWPGSVKGPADRTSTALRDAIQSKIDAVGSAATGMADAAKAPIAALPPVFFRSGVSAGALFAAGLESQIDRVMSTGVLLAQGVAGPIETHSPPKKGPLRGIDKWGPALVDAWVDPIRGTLGKVAKVGDELGRAMAPRPAFAMAGDVPGFDRLSRAGVGALAGDGIARAEHHHYHIGTLIADDAGLREFERRRERAIRTTRRQRRQNRMGPG